MIYLINRNDNSVFKLNKNLNLFFSLSKWVKNWSNHNYFASFAHNYMMK